jgi:hypothetical protein
MTLACVGRVDSRQSPLTDVPPRHRGPAWAEGKVIELPHGHGGRHCGTHYRAKRAEARREAAVLSCGP